MHFHIILKELLISTLTVIIVIILIPTLPILLIPIYLTRQTVKLLAKKLKPDYQEMFSGYTSILTAPGVHSKPKGNNRSYSATLNLVLENTDINMSKIEEVGEMLLTNKKFAKAKMIMVKWMGFYFWKRITNFDLKSHLILHEEPINENEFENLIQNVINHEPYSKDKPLWEIHLFSNYIHKNDSSNNSRYSAVALKIHHCLCDFFSLLDIVDEINLCLIKRDAVNSNKTVKFCPSWKPKTAKEIAFNNFKDKKAEKTVRKSDLNFLFILRLFLLGPFQLVRDLIISISTTIKHKTWIKPNKEQQTCHASVPLELLKTIAANNGVGVSAVIFAGLTGALRQLMIDLGINPLPASLSVVGPVPLPWPRPPTLTNHFVALPIQAPIGEPDAFKRLAWVQKEFDGFKTSIKPLVFHAFFSVIGGFFYWITEALVNTPFGAGSFSIAPGPYDLGQSLGINFKKFNGTGGMPHGDVVLLGFYSFSISDCVYFGVAGDTALFKLPSSTKRFIDCVFREFEIFNRAKLNSEIQIL